MIIKKQLIYLYFLCAIGWAPSVNGQNKAIKSTITNFAQGYSTNDYSLIQPLLAKDFSIGIYSGEFTGKMVKSILKSYHGLDSLQIQKVESDPSGKRVTVQYFFKDKPPFTSSITLNHKNKVKYVDFFDHLYHIDRHKKAQKKAVIPFQIVEGAIAIPIKLNQSSKPLTMLFDTGADGMALTQKAAKAIGIKNTKDHKTSVVGATQKVKFSSGNTVHIDTLLLQNQNLVIFPEIRGDFDGIIGGNILKNFITEVNFDTQEMTLYNFGNFRYNDKGGTPFPIDYSTYVPVINLSLKFNKDTKVSGQFVFDTGAGYNLIAFGPFVKRHHLTENFKADYQSTNFSFGHQSQIAGGEIPQIEIGSYKLSKPMISLQRYNEKDEEWADKAGSLGFNIIKRFNFIINVLDKTVYLAPNTSFKDIFDFYVKGMFIGVDHKQNLVVKNVTRGSIADQKGIQKGSEIHSINGISAKDLIKGEGIHKLSNQKTTPTKNFNILLTQGDSSMQLTL